MATSGNTAQTAVGEHTGAEMDQLAKSMSTPPNYMMPFPLVREYMIAMWKWDKNGGPSLPDQAFTSVIASDLDQILPANFTKYAVEDILRGVWCGPVHPSSLACFVTYPSDKEHLPNAKGLPAQGFIPGHVFMWDSPGERNTLEFFTRYDTEFQFPRWAKKDVNNGSASAIWTSARRPFDIIPYPVAVYEGFPNSPLQMFRMRKLGGFGWDPETSQDPALCFCSAHFAGDDVIVRNNFGKESYRVYRVIDGDGKKTRFWPELQTWAAGRRLVKVNFPLQADTSCPGSCQLTVFFQCLLFYLPLILMLCCCCTMPCLCTSWCLGKQAKRRAKASNAEEEEEEEDMEDYEEDNEQTKLT